MKWTQNSGAKTSAALAQLARKALASAPENGSLWHALANRLVEAGQSFGAADAFREAVCRAPDNLLLRREQINNLIQIDRFEEALDSVHAGLKFEPGDPMLRILRFDVMMLMHRFAEALPMADEIAEIYPSNPLLLRLREVSPEMGSLEDMLEHCDALLAKLPGNTPATYFKVLTLARLRRDGEARRTIALREFVSLSDDVHPSEYPDAGSFCDALAGEMACNESFILDGRGKVTERSYVSTNLEQPSDKATPLLRRMFQRAIENYATSLPDEPGGFIAARPKVATLHIWGVVNRGQDGRLGAHYHGNAWLSGVYYVKAPRSVADGSYLGPLILGEVDAMLAPRNEPPWERIFIAPIPGTLILFPSYVPHATQPSRVDSDRICISFDVIPAEGSFAAAEADG